MVELMSKIISNNFKLTRRGVGVGRNKLNKIKFLFNLEWAEIIHTRVCRFPRAAWTVRLFAFSIPSFIYTHSPQFFLDF